MSVDNCSLLANLCRFHSKYGTEEHEKRRVDARATVQRRCDVFMQLIAMGRTKEVSCSVEKTMALIKLLDAGQQFINHVCLKFQLLFDRQASGTTVKLSTCSKYCPIVLIFSRNYDGRRYRL